MATVIIPAYNEASVIRRCLDSLLQQRGVEQIIVACNGCRDNTAEIVRTEYPQVTCLDIEKPSKVNALNEAEQHVKFWPVVYLDADLEFSENGIEKVVSGMHKRGVLLASPTPIMNLSQSSWAVKQYYKIHRQLSYVRRGVIGTGTFVLDKAGRSRFGRFPDVINDDHYVRCQFQENEIANIPDSFVTVHAPKGAWSLIKILTRSQLGNIEIEENSLGLDKSKPRYAREFLPHLLSKNVLSMLCYIGLVSTAKMRARKQYASINTYSWEVDSSSRT